MTIAPIEPEVAEAFAFEAVGELYLLGGSMGKRSTVYRRFDTAAEAIQYAVELLPSQDRSRCVIEVEEDRLDARQIMALYTDPSFPLPRAGQTQ
jgi:hypothetical protein